AAPAGGEDPSDGFPSLRDVERAPAIGAVTRLAADGAQGPAVIGDDETVDAWVAHGADAGWWRAWAPGPPGSPARRFAWLRVHGTAGRIVTVWSWRRAVQTVTIEGKRTVVSFADGTRHLHQRSAHGWRVDVGEEHARTVVRLAGARRGSDEPESTPSPWAAAAPGDAEPRPLGQGALWRFELGAESYRASEDAWQDVGRPSATVTIGREGDSVVVEVHVRKRPLDFRPRVAHNDLDNEPADVNSDGVQLHLQVTEPASWLLVPEPDGAVRSTPSSAARAIALAASWRPVAEGYVLRCLIPVRDLLPWSSDTGPVVVRIGVAVNLTTPARERRQGQLVLGGARGEFVYLQGDRLAPDRYLPFAVPHD
ncbi:MAG TPA: hypothetical protein VHQ45_17805, partial [Gemmatimonadaceae bacterium]|nr:hypothetical protein [Gemmatimonadaceae bacterium]